MLDLSSTLDYLIDSRRRHVERHTPTSCVFAMADSIQLVNGAHWDQIAKHNSLFLSRSYLRVLEQHAPGNIMPRYAMIYRPDQLETPLAIVYCQLIDLSLANFQASSTELARELVSQWVSGRVLVCGNVISNGPHGVAFAPNIDLELGWRAVAELIYKLRRAEQLTGSVDGALLKDFSPAQLQDASVLKRYSYRTIKTDPDMCISFAESTSSFEDYLAALRSKVRRKVKKVIKGVADKGYTVERLDVLQPHQPRLQELYQRVEARAELRLACISDGYFAAMSQALGERFRCSVIKRADAHLAAEEIIAFIITVADSGRGISYYVGFERDAMDSGILYRRLLLLSIEDALAMGCQQLSLGRTALEAKANLGAKPVDAYVWARHRVPTVNFFARKLFRWVPSSVAPERTVFKLSEQRADDR